MNYHSLQSSLPGSRNYYRNTGKMAYERRRRLFSLTIILIANAVLKTSHAQNDENIDTNPVVTIAQGKVAGRVFPCRNNNYALAFMGIPYGQAPVGNLRFRSPLPAEGWGDKIFDGTKSGPACLQISKVSIPMKEDCLHVTVYTPKLPNGNETSLLPTIVYVYGGMFIGGAVEPELINPNYFFGVSEKAVLVQPSFRSGALGYLSTGDGEAPGNYALKDIVLALKWVQKNIRAFGGDPNQVTVIGHSSGAATAHFLTLSPLTKGLFHRFGTGSGTFSVGWAYSPRRIAAKNAYQFGMMIGCTQDTSFELLRCLREKPSDEILKATALTILMNLREIPTWRVTDEPDIEGAFLIGSPLELVAAGKFHDLPWVNGLTRDEGLVLSTQLHFHMDLVREFLPQFDNILTISSVPYYRSIDRNMYAEILHEYFFNNHSVSNAVLFDNLTSMIGDTSVIYPACLAMKHWVSHAKSPVYLYSFEYVGTHSLSFKYCACDDYLGVSHADDSQYLLDLTGVMKQYSKKNLTDTDFEMADIIVKMWISFATTGVPTLGPGTPQWKPFTIAEESALSIGQENKIVIKPVENYCRDRMTYLEDLFAKLI